MTKLENIQKRDGTIVPFDQTKVETAIWKSARSIGGTDNKTPKKLAAKVTERLEKVYSGTNRPSVEAVQDMVERVLSDEGHFRTAKAYILYREERAQVREKQKVVPPHVKKLAQESKKYFRNELAEFVYYRTYSRWIEAENRRETWIETVKRYIDFMRENLGDKLTQEEYEDVYTAILNQESMPSMRLLWSAGPAAKTTNVSAYNCSFIAPSQFKDFAEIMYLLMCGTGVGFSIESQTAQQFPIVQPQTGEKLAPHVIGDSKEGWGDSLIQGLEAWYAGKDLEFDYSQLRLAGARLNTMGGRSSGPDPLKNLLIFVRQKILARQGKRLSNLDVHDIVCKIGEIVVMGGVRRSALISLSDLDDDQMRDSKKGQFYLTEPQRSMANNSAVYMTKPSATQFMEEWLSLAKSGTGERGIFNRGGLKKQLPERRWKVLEKHANTAGTNPCGEIILRSKQFCNLSEVVARHEDTEETLLHKVRIATILGTYQSSLTHFPYLSKEWTENCEEEALLGVSITGQWDCPVVRDATVLNKLKEEALRVNEEYAKRFGINRSTCVTCVKPSGTVSQLVDAASGMHPRHSEYYIRRVRISATDPLFHMLREQKFPYKPEVGQDEKNATTYVLDFPVKAAKDTITKNDLTAMDQLEHWKLVKENYTEHNPSVTVSVSEDEWIPTMNWLYERWENIGGLSFLPRSNHVYQLAPYEAISEAQYNELVTSIPKVDFSNIVAYETEDHTKGAKELACVAGACEIDLGEAGGEEELQGAVQVKT